MHLDLSLKRSKVNVTKSKEQDTKIIAERKVITIARHYKQKIKNLSLRSRKSSKNGDSYIATDQKTMAAVVIVAEIVPDNHGDDEHNDEIPPREHIGEQAPTTEESVVYDTVTQISTELDDILMATNEIEHNIQPESLPKDGTQSTSSSVLVAPTGSRAPEASAHQDLYVEGLDLPNGKIFSEARRHRLGTTVHCQDNFTLPAKKHSTSLNDGSDAFTANAQEGLVGMSQSEPVVAEPSLINTAASEHKDRENLSIDEADNASCADSSYQRDLELFKDVRDAVDYAMLEGIALLTRYKDQLEDGKPPANTTCHVQGPAQFGSYNMVVLLQFGDGLAWVAKIPGYGAHPSPLQERKMESEYQTSRFIEAKGVKVPKVHFWTVDPSVAGVAFGLMDYIKGESLTNCWVDPDFDHQKCLRAVGDVACEMAKLYLLQFATTGALRFNTNGEPDGINPELHYVTDGECNWAELEEQGPFASTGDWIDNLIQENKKPFRHCLRDRRNPAGTHVLSAITRTIPNFLRNAPLSLCLADPDFQNIYVDPETGELQAFIDMDNLRVAPVIIGSAAFPPIITRDRDLHRRRQELMDYGFAHAQGGPEIDKVYRKYYANCFQAALPHDTHYDTRWTEYSHHVYYLDRAQRAEFDARLLLVQKMSGDAYANVYGPLTQTLKDLRRKDMTSCNPIRSRRFTKTIEQGLWQPESTTAPIGQLTTTTSSKKPHPTEAGQQRFRHQKLGRAIRETLFIHTGLHFARPCIAQSNTTIEYRSYFPLADNKTAVIGRQNDMESTNNTGVDIGIIRSATDTVISVAAHSDSVQQGEQDMHHRQNLSRRFLRGLQGSFLACGRTWLPIVIAR